MDWTAIIEALINYGVKIIVMVAVGLISYYLVPWLKRRGLYELVMYYVKGAKEFGINLNLTGEQKYQLVIDELKALGINTNNSYVIMTVKAAVTELRDVTGKT